MTGPNAAVVRLRYRNKVHEVEVQPEEVAGSLGGEIWLRWDILPSQQRLLLDGMSVPLSLELGDFEGKELLVTKMEQGGGPVQDTKRRKRGSKGSARRAAKERLKRQSELMYDKVKQMMESRSNRKWRICRNS